MKLKKIKNLLNQIKLSKSNILVLGDVMLDQYIFGDVDRVSPEAPVPILNYKNKKDVLGGAGNVVHNLVNLGNNVSIATIIGNDLHGKMILRLIQNIGGSTDLILKLESSNTTTKTRFLSGGTQLLRLDHDSVDPPSSTLKSYRDNVIKNLEKFDCLIISDYNKGVCEKLMLQSVIHYANSINIPVFIDPKGTKWDKYKDATCLTPNTKEVEKKLDIELVTDSDFELAAKNLKRLFNLKSIIITRGSDGMTYCNDGKILHQKVEKKEVFDVSGAGDTVISCLASSFINGISIDDSIELSNFASCVVSHTGTTPFDVRFLKRTI